MNIEDAINMLQNNVYLFCKANDIKINYNNYKYNSFVNDSNSKYFIDNLIMKDNNINFKIKVEYIFDEKEKRTVNFNYNFFYTTESLIKDVCKIYYENIK